MLARNEPMDMVRLFIFCDSYEYLVLRAKLLTNS